jgi:hypothetical protein
MEIIDMRSTAYLGIALGTLFVAATALADDHGPGADSLAQLPPNPVTSPTTADKGAAAPADERHHRHNKHAGQSETASAAPAGGAAAPAATSATTAAGDPATQPPAQPKKICRSIDVLGSKIAKRVCATQEEWAAFNNHAREDAQDGLRRLQDQGANSPASPGVSASQLPP